ncbi:hypothetical protein OAP24_03615 [Porticoccaceae bacterium]|nr:hypothetical protein [Porticoccaceae bacterium]
MIRFLALIAEIFKGAQPMGTFGSRDAATERTGMYLQRVPIGCAPLNISVSRVIFLMSELWTR